MNQDEFAVDKSLKTDGQSMTIVVPLNSKSDFKVWADYSSKMRNLSVFSRKTDQNCLTWTELQAWN